MDYSEILIRLDQHMNVYRHAVLKKQINIASEYAKSIQELAEALVAATKGMK